MKPFNLEEAKAGKPVCTKDGDSIRIICFNAKGDFPIIALKTIGNVEVATYHKNDGIVSYNRAGDGDNLMMVDELDTLPNTWEEWVKQNPYTSNEYFINGDSMILNTNLLDTHIRPEMREPYYDANLLPSEKYAKAILALIKLIRLRDCYRQGWKPDYEDGRYKCFIHYDTDNNVSKATARNSRAGFIFVFQSIEIRDKFYNNFKDLLEQAKILWQ